MMENNLILLHGALGSKKQLSSLKDNLSNQFQVYDLDFEGHGGRASDNAFSIDLFSTNLLEFIREKNLGVVHLFGYSMGGYVALDLASKHPDLIGKIVTLGTKFDWTEATAEKEVKMLNPDKIEEKIPKFAQYLKELHQPNDWKEVLRKTAQMMLDLGTGDRLEADVFQQIKLEVLIGIGSLDKMVSLEESENTANLLSNSTLKVVDGFPHPIEKVDTRQLAKIIVDFLI